MKSLFSKTILCVLLLFLGFGCVFGQEEFSLDDDPSNPVNSSNIPPFRSAEDEFGIIYPPFPPANPPCAGSPMLAWGGRNWIDSDILSPAPPTPSLSFSIPGFVFVDGISANHQYVMPPDIDIELRFSIDRATSGIPGSDAFLNSIAPNGQYGDIYFSTTRFTHPSFFVGTLPFTPPFAGALPTAFVGGSNLIHRNENYFNLLVGAGPDNIDAYNDQGGPLLSGDIFFTVHPLELPWTGYRGGDIVVFPIGGPYYTLYASATSMGLDWYGVNTDSIDGIVVFDENVTGGPVHLDPGTDYALFSLAPGSQLLTQLQNQGYLVDGGSVFFTDFTGVCALYAHSSDLGLAPLPPYTNINIDALECIAH